MPSRQQLSSLPGLQTLKSRLQRLAAIDAAFAAQLGGELPCYCFHPDWSPQEQLATYKNGSGDEVFVHFTPHGCFLKGFAHESVMSPHQTEPAQLWPGLLDGVPESLRASLQEPAFDVDSTTFVVWRLQEDPQWSSADIPYPDEAPEQQYGELDGSAELLPMLTISATAFATWLDENYEVDVAFDIVEATLAGAPLSRDRLMALCPDADWSDLEPAVRETGHPVD